MACGLSFGDADLGSAEPDGINLPDRSQPDAEVAAPPTPPAPRDAGQRVDSSADGATNAGPRKAFVSSTLTNGNIGGVAGADALCNAAAKAAALPGTYTAWISTAAVNAIDRITSEGPWQLVDGTEIAKTRADLVKGSLVARFDKDEKGSVPPAVEDRVWTGTGGDGKSNGTDCAGWTTTSGSGRVGEAAQPSNNWTSLANEACSEVNRVYCFQN